MSEDPTKPWKPEAEFDQYLDTHDIIPDRMQADTGIRQKDTRFILDVDWAGKLISEGSRAVG